MSFYSDGWQSVGIIGGVRASGMYFVGYPSDEIVCGRHLRAPLQPVTNYDMEKGYGTGDCPFCSGGSLHGQFHKYRSVKRWREVLKSL